MKNHDQNEYSLLHVINLRIKQQSCQEGRKPVGSRAPWGCLFLFQEEEWERPRWLWGPVATGLEGEGRETGNRDQSEGHLHLIRGRDEKGS